MQNRNMADYQKPWKLISHDNCVEHEEETVAVEANTIGKPV